MILACDLTLSPDIRLRLDEGRQNVVADEIRAHFHEIIALPAWERRAAIDAILDRKKERNNVPTR